MYIIKRNDPNIEPCGTPASTDDQFEHWPLKPLSETYYSKSFLEEFPDTPICSSLNSNPSCHTLSNALDISRKFALTSRVKLA